MRGRGVTDIKSGFKFVAIIKKKPFFFHFNFGRIRKNSKNFRDHRVDVACNKKQRFGLVLLKP